MFHQSAQLVRTWEIAWDRRSITFRSYETLPSGQVGIVEQPVSTAFSIRDVAPRGANQVFVGGEPDNGGFLIEQWTLPDSPGSMNSAIGIAGTAIGVPSPSPATQVYVPGGGPQIPFDQRAAPAPVRRQSIAADTSVQYVALGADPDGRFLLLVTKDGDLRQYAVPGEPASGGVFTLIADSVAVPSLAHVSGLMARFQHASYGRIWLLRWFDAREPDGTAIRFDQWETLVLEDVANDGVFEVMSSHLNTSSALHGYLDPALILDDFVNVP